MVRLVFVACATALAEYRAAIAANSRLGEAHNNLAVVLFTTGRVEEARREADAARTAGYRVDPRFPEGSRLGALAAPFLPSPTVHPTTARVSSVTDWLTFGPN